MTDQERIARGDAARTLLAGDGFNSLYEFVSQDLMAEMLSCTSEEATTPIFRQYDGMRNFLYRLRGYVSERDAIILAYQQDAADREQERFDN